MELYKDRDWLQQKYWGDNLTLDKIAVLANCSKATVRRNMIKLNISRRDTRVWTDERKQKLANSISGENHPQWKEKIIVHCKNCGVDIEIFKEDYDNGKIKPYCNRMCRWEHERGPNNRFWKGRIRRVCKGCGKIFYVQPYVVRNGEGIFHSKYCQNVYQTGENSPNWKHDIVRSYPEEWTLDFKEYIRKRDKRRCAICNSRKNRQRLNVHHIDHDKMNTVPENCISLCVSCHMKVHNSHVKFWKRKLSELALKREGIVRTPIVVNIVRTPVLVWNIGASLSSSEGQVVEICPSLVVSKFSELD